MDHEEPKASGPPSALEHERRMAQEVVDSRVRLPPLVNDQALFTLAATYGNTRDPFYHPPSTRIAANLTPSASEAAAVLFEEFPSDPNKPRKASQQPLSEIRSMFASSRPVRRKTSARNASREGTLEATLQRLRGADEGEEAEAPREEPSEASTASLESDAGGEAVQMREMAARGGPLRGINVPWGDGVPMGERRRGPERLFSREKCASVLRQRCPSSLHSSGSGAPSPCPADPTLVGLPAEISQKELQEVVDAVMRYHYYVEEGISERHIAPYRDEWAANALTLIPQHPPQGVSEEFYYDMVEESLKEMHR